MHVERPRGNVASPPTATDDSDIDAQRRHQRLERQLIRDKNDQLARFARSASEFAAVHAKLSRFDATFYRDPPWTERITAFERFLLPVPEWDFLRHPSILYSMLVPPSSYGPAMRRLRTTYDVSTLARVLQEDPAGGGPRFSVGCKHPTWVMIETPFLC